MNKQYIKPVVEVFGVQSMRALLENSGEINGDDAMGKKQQFWDDDSGEWNVNSSKNKLWDDDDDD